MKSFVFAAAVLASPLTFAGGFLDLGHVDWAAFLVSSYASSTASMPPPATTQLLRPADPATQEASDRPVSAAAPSTADFNFTTGAPRLTSPGVSP